jgi:sRNA-binding regulator protein Hfq
MKNLPAGKPTRQSPVKMEQQLIRCKSRFQRSVPPAATNAETYYLIKQKDAKTPVVVALLDGEHIEGTIEWYDGGCLKIRKADGCGIVVMKSFIERLYKQHVMESASPS